LSGQGQSGMLSFELNGSPVQVDNASDLTLLELLRDRLGITSPKNGCAPAGQCGCCTVLIEGLPQFACRTAAAQIAGKQITTLEGLPEEARRLLAECFVQAGAVQCGYCTPGIAMRTHALLERNPNPSRAEIVAELVGHFCRCTGYKKIIDAIELLARVRRGEPLPSSGSGTGGVGSPLGKYGGRELVLGQRNFIDDITVPGMVHAVMRYSDHPRALVKRIDTSAAEAMPGVLQVATWRDVPGDRYIGLVEKDWPIFVAEGEETRCVGDILAAVAAADERSARRAAEAVKIEYEVRPPVTNPDEALKPDAPKVHPAGNLLSRSALVRGDVDAAFAASAHIVEGEWQTQRIEHLFLEPEACLAIPVCCPHGKARQAAADKRDIPWHDLQAGVPFKALSDVDQGERGLFVLSQGQGVFDDQRQISSILGWPLDRVHVELVSCGGAFGGKEDMSIQGQTALLAHLVGKPVKTVLNRRESLRLHPKRHPTRLRYKVGCDADGRLTALRARIIGDKGAYASVGAHVIERTAGHSAGPYRFPNVDIEALAVYTNNPPCGAMRGFGVCQAAFAIEACLDMLAEKVGIDAWEMRSRNIIEPGDAFCSGQRMTKPFGLRKTLEAVKEIYRNAKYAGIACGVKNVGIGNGMPEAGRASLTVESNGRITIRSGFTEMGQGLFTVLIQAAVEETGLPADIFDVTTDTRDDVNCGQTTASRGTVLGCHGVIAAARKLNADLKAGERLTDLAGRVYGGRWDCYPTDDFGTNVPDPKTHLTYGFATQVVILDNLGRVRKIVAAHDAGRVMNPKLAEGQIEGAIHMGLGYALTEEFVVENGEVRSNDIRSCGALRAHQMPEVQVIFVEEGDPDCPYGAKGIGEIGLVPTAAAVAGALYSFDRVRRTRLPMKDSPAAKAIINLKPPKVKG
jgi:CO/xanthine dehydrogenase Mo-binding subunit/aerobic-type carbon monoxide dehydrogenase small subunit (CoxS/CutS family)